MKKSMKKLVAIFSLICSLISIVPSFCSAQGFMQRMQGRVPADKVEHAGVSYALMDVADQHTHWSVWEKRLFVLGIGVAKECSDPVFDRNDLAADVAGIALHELVHYKITW